jgi:hypothetical protein
MKTTGYKESLNQYQDLVNQPTFADYLGNAFSKVGSQPAVGEAQRMSNAMLSGMGAGISGAAAEERKQKLSPMLEQAGRITAKAAELEAQMQESEQNRLKITQFMKQSAVPIAQLSQASLAGDRPASNELAKGIYLNFKQQADDPTMGDFDHYHNGVIYYHNLETGAIEGENVIGLMYQAGIDPVSIWGQDAPMIEAGLSPGAKKNYEDSEKMRQLEMEGKRADVSLKQAHAGVYQQQANQIQNEMQAPKPKYDDKTLTHNRTQNSDWVNSLYKKHKDLKGVIKVQTEIKDAIQKEIDNNSWNTGSSFFAELTRWANEKSGDNQTQQLIALKRQPLFKELKNIFPTRITDVDLATWLTTQVDLSTDPTLAISELESRINESQDEIKEEEIRREVLENDFGNSEPYNSLLVDQKVKEKIKSNSEFVVMTGPAGTIKIPAGKKKLFESNNYKELKN